MIEFKFRARQRYILIGMGAFGIEIARTLKKHNADFMIFLHRDHEGKAADDIFSPDRLRQLGFKHVYETDVTSPDALRRHIKADNVVVLSHGKDFETKLLTIEALKELGCSTIYARATRDMHSRILNKMGITKVLFPEKQEGKRFALELLNEQVKSIDEVAPQVYISEVPIPPAFVGKTIVELQLRTRFNVTVICVKEYATDIRSKQDQQTDHVIVHSKEFERIPLTLRHTLVIAGEGEFVQQLCDMVDDSQEG